MMWRRSALEVTWRLGFALLLWGVPVGRAFAIPDLRFDVVTFCCDCANTGSEMCTNQFDVLNFPSTNGHYIAMGSDTYRSNLLANGNLLAIYYNDFDTGWPTTTAAQMAAAINEYGTSMFTATGPLPNWVVLNEISSGTWPTNQSYRTWVENVVQLLNTNYGYSVIVYSPFPNPANNTSDWQAVAANSYIAVENYLSGQAIAAENFSVSWCQEQYASSITSYNGVGVPTSRLILGEDFSQTVSGTSYGRAGVTSNQWDSAISARSEAALNDGFAGFIGYAWDGNALGVSENEMVSYEDVYATNPLPSAEVLTLPYPALPPQNQIAPPGSIASFTVIPAGDAPTTYQWTFNGAPLSGATASILTLTNIAPTNAGSYAVLLSNAVGRASSSSALLSVQIPPPLVYEPFANATSSGGTSYATGSDLIGETNAAGLTWYQAGPDSALTNQPIIQSNNLVYPGLAFPEGNSIEFGGGGGMAARISLYTNGAGISNGTVYFSFVLTLTNITGLSSSGVFWAGFNNLTGAQTTTPSVVATRIYTRSATGGFNLGLSKASGTASDWQWDTIVRHEGDVLFLVGSYAFNTNSTNDDVSDLWINPAVTTFGTATAPAPTLVTSSGADISSSIIESFALFNRDPTEPAGGAMDELRIGTSWASVTPPSGPGPTLAIARSGSNVILTWPTNATGFNLRYSPSLTATSVWTTVPFSLSIVGGQYTVTNPVGAAPEYFRLQEP